jgi:hypothetical protein
MAAKVDRAQPLVTFITADDSIVRYPRRKALRVSA